MAIVYRVKTTDGAGGRLAVRRAMSHMHTGCASAGAYRIGPDSASMGWTFFTLSIDDALEEAIGAKFADMIRRYRGKAHEKLDSFMSDYLESRGSNVKISRADA
ncbi:MAG: hypothetical protein OXU37_04415 [Thaumarchaeota archaeon]|nr:hypothetical protein [Nitrososphaerota archaeon]MDD9813495.1 hypothetical protein [Nitrososphaerota archaeon]RNJ72046.1 MAG: hypothetical protein EB833_05680 [Thaumarchaeota archaeon S13]